MNHYSGYPLFALLTASSRMRVSLQTPQTVTHVAGLFCNPCSRLHRFVFS